MFEKSQAPKWRLEIACWNIRDNLLAVKEFLSETANDMYSTRATEAWDILAQLRLSVRLAAELLRWIPECNQRSVFAAASKRSWSCSTWSIHAQLISQAVNISRQLERTSKNKADHCDTFQYLSVKKSQTFFSPTTTLGRTHQRSCVQNYVPYHFQREILPVQIRTAKEVKQDMPMQIRMQWKNR